MWRGELSGALPPFVCLQLISLVPPGCRDTPVFAGALHLCRLSSCLSSVDASAPEDNSLFGERASN